MAKATTIKFTGREDLRILGAADLKKAGVEDFRQTTFAQGEAVEVEANVAEALLGNSDLFGTFEAVEREAPAEDKGSKSTDTSSKATGDAAKP